ncbi:hypothetical protein [Bacteroides eggerthii]|jgi:hypothetical protein|uniref:DegT/DnrJ/EryC1/StrS aminotransferase family protein n=1 Tax=Bacteroides eggerthii TaxID=28111 RepID=A0A380YJZ7_9BACE|nr:hypothetical protein [Bacteroides eggerthii]EEC52942.1 hypothetical protein BACEGG_02821 [Bacteroides eggerthii DSM 20697]QRQ47777.1 hypothetical protein I6J51_11990 [Bacteroides eggerthii]UWN86674.1 hypothetical protein NQ546_10775 [Bacteroides eggerthii]SUV29054.1 Uncharacterised protein [Bacteroides eggerthii]
MEIGSFLELQLPKDRELYRQETDIARLNTGRMGIWHAFRVTGCKRIWIPIYQCDSIRKTFEKKGVEMCFYHQDKDWNPLDIEVKEDDAVLLVNYYGIMSSERMTELAKPYVHIIIDCAQAFFCHPVKGALTVYSCRKFVGVPDGAYVIGKDAHKYVEEYPQCYSSDTATFLLKRIEYGCEGKGYEARSLNEHRIDTEDCMQMSKLTRTLMDAEDYIYNQQKRKENFTYVHRCLSGINKIEPTRYMDEETIPMVYPLVVEDDALIQKLFAVKHFQGHWWSYICEEQSVESFEYWISRYIIPITIDQRYGKEEMDYLVNVIKNK